LLGKSKSTAKTMIYAFDFKNKLKKDFDFAGAFNNTL
jgi:hypothetical protein